MICAVLNDYEQITKPAGLLLLLTQTGIALADSDERFGGIKAGFELTNTSGIPVTEQVLLGHYAIIQRN